MARVICPQPGVQLTVMTTTAEEYCQLTVHYYFMPMYGPEEWFRFETVTQLRQHGPLNQPK